MARTNISDVLTSRLGACMEKAFPANKFGDGKFLELIERLLPLIMGMFGSCRRARGSRRRDIAERTTGELDGLVAANLKASIKHEFSAEGDDAYHDGLLAASLDMAAQTTPREMRQGMRHVGL